MISSGLLWSRVPRVGTSGDLPYQKSGHRTLVIIGGVNYVLSREALEERFGTWSSVHDGEVQAVRFDSGRQRMESQRGVARG
jgi:hypothetical protein